MMIADYRTRIRRPVRNPGNVPHKSTAAVAAIARNPRGTYRANFRGARFGHGLYNGYFAQKNGVDPRGRRLFAIEVVATSEEDGAALEDITQLRLKGTFRTINNMVEKLEMMSDDQFEEAKSRSLTEREIKKGYKHPVTFAGREFTGTRKRYIELLKREKESKVYRLNRGGFQKFTEEMTKLAKSQQKFWDTMGGSAHGDKFRKGAYFNSNTSIPFTKLVQEEARIKAHMKTPGNYVFATCYNNANGVLEGYSVVNSSGVDSQVRAMFKKDENGKKILTKCLTIEYTPPSISRTEKE